MGAGLLKILLLTQVLPYPPDSGPKIKTFNVLKYLSACHQVYLVSFVRSAAEVAHASALRDYCQEVHTVPIRRSVWRDAWFFACSLLANQPFIIARDRSRPMHTTIAKLMAKERFDVVHADQLNMAQYAVTLQGVHKVLDAHNAVWTIFHQMWQNTPPGPRKWALRMEWQKLKWYEGEVGRQFDAILAVSEEDREALVSAGCPDSRLTVIPIAIDTQETRVIQRDSNARSIIHIGTMFWPPNIEGILWFARQVYPLIQGKVPQVRLYLVGARPPAEIRALEKQDTSIRVTGYVEDVVPYLQDSAVFVVPLHVGSGMRVKILEAWAWGTPIVTTSVGCAGIPVHPGEDILIADTAEDFAAAVVQVLQDGETGAKLSVNGRRYVEDQFDWRVVCQKLDEVYERIASSGRD